MRKLICVLLLLTGCGESAELAAMKAAFEAAGDEVVAKQDESLVILRENTTALAALKSQVESLASETREATDTLKASLTAPKPKGEEVIKSALEPQEATRPNPSQPLKPVASPPAVRSSSVVMKWNVEGNWNPTILETAKHLREDHGIIADGMTHQQMHDAHAAAHEGRQVAMKSQTVRIVNQGTYCPNGQCPTSRQTVRMRWRR